MSKKCNEVIEAFPETIFALENCSILGFSEVVHLLLLLAASDDDWMS